MVIHGDPNDYREYLSRKIYSEPAEQINKYTDV